MCLGWLCLNVCQNVVLFIRALEVLLVHGCFEESLSLYLRLQVMYSLAAATLDGLRESLCLACRFGGKRQAGSSVAASSTTWLRCWPQGALE